MSSYTCENLTSHSLQHSISSYGSKTTSRRRKLHFYDFFQEAYRFIFILLPLSRFSRSYKMVDRKLKFLRRGILRDEFLHV